MVFVDFETTFTDELVAFLFSARSTTVYRRILWERFKKRNNISKHTYDQNIYRLKKRGLITTSREACTLSEKGILYHKNPYRNIIEKPTKKQKIILIFDIPENKKKVREWLRLQIKLWGFTMIQKSVWVGYGPLPKEFIKRLKDFEVEEGVKTFKVQSK